MRTDFELELMLLTPIVIQMRLSTDIISFFYLAELGYRLGIKINFIVICFSSGKNCSSAHASIQ